MRSSSINLKTLYEYEQCTDNDIVSELNELVSNNDELRKYMEITGKYVKFRHYAGFIPTKNYRIQVLPKIKNLEEGEEKSKENLIRILLYIFSSTGMELPQLEIKNNDNVLDIMELIIRLYALSLEEQILQGAYRKYIRFSGESKYLRGKLNFGKQINRIDQSKFYLNDFKFSMDNDLNRFFAHANRFFIRVTNNNKNANLLAWIDGILHEEDISPLGHSKINFNRMNERFRIPYIYASLILDNLVMMSGDGSNTVAMIFDMNRVFEQFFAKFISRNARKIFGDTLPEVKIQDSNYNFIYDNNDNVLRYTKPDLILFFEGYRYIFDTKYKKLDEPRIDKHKYIPVKSNSLNPQSIIKPVNKAEIKPDKAHSIAPGDLYQMYTYSQIYDSKAIILVFPGSESKLSHAYRFTANDNKKLWVYMIKMDLNCDKREVKCGKWERELIDSFKNAFMEIIKVDHQKNCTFL